MKRILVDMDLTLNNFLQYFCEFAHTIYGMDFEGNVFDSYDLCSHMTKSTTENEDVKKQIFENNLFWKNIPVMPDSYNVLMKLQNKGYNLCIATMLPPKAHYTVKDMIRKEKYEWLQKWFPTIKFEHIYMDVPKYTIDADYLIDDYKKNIGEGKTTFKGKWIKMLYDFNKDDVSDYTVSNWKQIDKLFENIEKDLI
jgi:5'-nucleotidase